MEVRFGIPAARVLGNESAGAGVLNEAAERRLNATITGCTLVIERQFRVDDVREDVGADGGAAAHRLHFQVCPSFEEVIGHVVTLVEIPLVFENKAVALEN